MSRPCDTCDRDQAWLRQDVWPEPRLEWPVLTAADLFTGCGGMTLGMDMAAKSMRKRLQVCLAVDSDANATQVYGHNFRQILRSKSATVRTSRVELLFDGKPRDSLTTSERQLRRIVGPIDVMVGGPPCQGHSDLNNHTRRRDPRNALYLRMVRATEVLEPRLVIVENVPAVLRDHSRVVDRGHSVLEQAGYCVRSVIINAQAVGVAQRRRRHLLIAARNTTLPSEFELSQQLEQSCCQPRTVRWAIQDLSKTGLVRAFDKAGTSSETNRNRIAWLFDNQMYDLPDTMRPPCHQDGGHSYRSVYGRLRWNRPSQTITTGFTSVGQGRFVHPSKRRVLTPHEAARLQGFPDFFDFTAGGTIDSRSVWSRLIGNAVPPHVIKAVLRELLRIRQEPPRPTSASSRSHSRGRDQ